MSFPWITPALFTRTVGSPSFIGVSTSSRRLPVPLRALPHTQIMHSIMDTRPTNRWLDRIVMLLGSGGSVLQAPSPIVPTARPASGGTSDPSGRNKVTRFSEHVNVYRPTSPRLQTQFSNSSPSKISPHSILRPSSTSPTSHRSPSYWPTGDYFPSPAATTTASRSSSSTPRSPYGAQGAHLSLYMAAASPAGAVMSHLPLRSPSVHGHHRSSTPTGYSVPPPSLQPITSASSSISSDIEDDPFFSYIETTQLPRSSSREAIFTARGRFIQHLFHSAELQEGSMQIVTSDDDFEELGQGSEMRRASTPRDTIGYKCIRADMAALEDSSKSLHFRCCHPRVLTLWSALQGRSGLVAEYCSLLIGNNIEYYRFGTSSSVTFTVCAPARIYRIGHTDLASGSSSRRIQSPYHPPEPCSLSVVTPKSATLSDPHLILY